MQVAGIIAEYNPIHTGHLYHMEETRARLGGDTAIVCAMSGDFVQRGDAAILDKFSRAEMALRCGADLVFELPLPYAVSSAERFARGAVALLASTGVVETLSFGSEAGELAPLETAVAALETAQYPHLLRQELRRGIPFAAARQAAVAALTCPETAAVLERPNNILAVEYLRALRDLGYPMRPLTVARTGAGHDGDADAGQCPSARALRDVLLQQEAPPEPWMPPEAWDIWQREAQAGRAPCTLSVGERALLSRLRMLPESAFQALPDASEGLHNRLFRAAREGATWREVLELAATKRYAVARIRRMLLLACLGVSRQAIPAVPPYLRLLGAGPRGRTLLAEMRRSAALPVLTKPAHVHRLSPEARTLFELEVRAGDLYDLCRPLPPAPGAQWRTTPVQV